MNKVNLGLFTIFALTIVLGMSASTAVAENATTITPINVNQNHFSFIIAQQ